MKIRPDIWLVFAVLLLYSCIKESINYSDEQEVRGVMNIEILEKYGEDIDKIETARFLVFKDASGTPKLELNELFTIPPVSPGEDEVSKFEIILKVSRKLSGNNTKIVVAVVNEPSAMKIPLDQVYDYNQLINLELDFADFLNNDHNNLQNGKTMPMTAAIRTNKVYATEQEARIDPAGMEILRAVAVVDIYMRKETGVEFDLGSGTNIILRNTYSKEYLVRNQEGADTFGKIQTIISGFITKSWTATATSNIPDITSGSNGLFVCSFYTPERTCAAPGNADKLILDITALSSQGEPRNGIATLDELNLNNIKTPINIIERNNTYRIIVTVTDNGLLCTATIVDWIDEDIEIEF